MTHIGHVLGVIPDWLPLGPLVDVDGVQAREVLGDWSHLPECDQPPRYLTEGPTSNHLYGFDKSETRPPVRQTRPGLPISELRGKHSGKVAILFNGASMAAHDLHRIRCPTIGMNRTHVGYPGYDGPQPDYLCVVDQVWFDVPKMRRSLLTHPRIINGSLHVDPIGYRVTRHPRMAPFSFDLERDGYAGPIPATTGHLALQFAVYLGFTELYCIGWDMGGAHFDGSKASIWFRDAIRYHEGQAPVLAARGIDVFVCGSPNSAVRGFKHAPFEAVCEES